ncbi:hypothetical protein ACFYNX_22910 [Streptomyces sp. NPDC007872]|uniref:hypothetical protein n=1 Tax=Streptomyces sp. NPDC007872 TaxID=3364782 RepID=UPI0036C90311
MTSEHRPTSSRITELLLPTPPATAGTPTTTDPATPETPGPSAPTGPPAPGTSAPGPPASGTATTGRSHDSVTSTPTGPPASGTTTGHHPAPGTSAPARPVTAGAAGLPAVETTARLRAIRPTDPTPPTGPARPAQGPSAPAHPSSAPPQAAPPRPSSPPAPSGPLAPPPRTSAFPAPARPAAVPAQPSAARPAPPRATPPSPAPVLPVAPPVVRPAAAPAAFAPPSPPSSYGRVPGHPTSHVLPPEAPVETTTRLRPVRDRGSAGRTAAVAACAVLGFGLIGGALAGVWLAASEPGKRAEPAGYAEARELWHNAPVDTLFPRTLDGPHTGPGAAGRTWTRIVVAPDAPCSSAVLAERLLAAVEPLGCERVLRATYTDATASSVITVGLVFTRADATAQRALGRGLTARLGQDVPPALPGPATVAARFGDRQRASWWTSAPADLPVVVTAVSGFADGRTVDAPQPADRATAEGRTDAVAQSGLGHEAKGITERLERLLRTTATAAAKEENR